MPPENIKKTLVICFLEVQKETNDTKWVNKFRKEVTDFTFNSFLPIGTLLIPLKTSRKSLIFCFQGDQKGTLVRKGLSMIKLPVQWSAEISFFQV